MKGIINCRSGRWVVALVAIGIIAATGWNIRRQVANWKPAASVYPGSAAHANEFDLSAATIPVGEILSGGPRKDGIPALTDPKFVAADRADFMQPDDKVIGVEIDGMARAYPLKILDSHEIVNDTLAGTPLAVTYCPLCDSSVVFDRRIAGQERELGVSGRLYKSNVLMYDRRTETESLLSQMMAAGVSGPLADRRLRRLPLEVTTWKAWSERHPTTEVMSIDTGHRRHYNRAIYAQYFDSPQLMFQAKPSDDRLPAKTPVLGIAAGRKARAYPIEKFLAEGEASELQMLDGKMLRIVGDPEASSLRVTDADEGIEWVYCFWFSWYSMNPETELWGE